MSRFKLENTVDSVTREIIRSNTHGDYVFCNMQIFGEIYVDGKQLMFDSVVWQNGVSFKGNDYSCPKNNDFEIQPATMWANFVSDMSDDAASVEELEDKWLPELSKIIIDATWQDACELYALIVDNAPQNIGEFGYSDDPDAA